MHKSIPENESSQEVQLLRDEIKRLRKSLSELTPSLDVLLKRRGFRIYRKEPSEDLILPASEFQESFYELMKKYSFRLFLRDVIKHQDFYMLENVTRYATSEVTRNYVEYLRKVGLVEKVSDGFVLSLRPIKSFGETLEWFVSETFKVEFTAEAIWGIKFKRPLVGGDYDLIAKVDGAILYMEIKSSPPKQIYQKEIPAFFDRLSDLLPEIINAGLKASIGVLTGFATEDQFWTLTPFIARACVGDHRAAVKGLPVIMSTCYKRYQKFVTNPL